MSAAAAEALAPEGHGPGAGRAPSAPRSGVGGGVTFAARPQDHSVKVNRKMYRGGAEDHHVSSWLRQDRLVVVETLDVDAPKTKLLVSQLDDYGVNSACWSPMRSDREPVPGLAQPAERRGARRRGRGIP
jgi:hypothetical protein